MTPRLSVVVPTLNRCDVLAHSLPALAHQAYPADRFEILLCDAGSTDGTADLLARLAIPQLRVLSGPDTGRAGARNRGIAESRGEIVVFTDADIVAADGWLAEHAAAHTQFPHSALVGCEIQVDSVGEIEEVRNRTRPRRTLHPDHRRRLSWLFFLTGNASVPRDLLLRAGSFDQGFQGYGHEDLELGYRLARLGVPIRYRAGAINYHVHPVSFDERCRKMRLAGASTVYFYRKHRDLRIALRLGLNPLSWAVHGLVPERVWHAWPRRAMRESLVLQHAYISGIKAAWRQPASPAP